jgi:hypothetical protein
MSDKPEAREEGFYWVVLGQNPPEIAYWERGEWWFAGDAKPWLPDAVSVLSDKLVFRLRRTPGRDGPWRWPGCRPTCLTDVRSEGADHGRLRRARRR